MRASCSFACEVYLRADKSEAARCETDAMSMPKLPARRDSDVTVENKAVTRQYGYWYRALGRIARAHA